MDRWELLVQDYLCVSRNVFVHPQYLVGGPRLWSACHDFLAIDHRRREIWAVEVSTSGRSFADKIAQFETEYKPRLRDQLERSGIWHAGSAWQLGLWLFTTKSNEAWCRNRLSRAQLERHSVTTLEDIALGWLDGSVWHQRHDDLPEMELSGTTS